MIYVIKGNIKQFKPHFIAYSIIAYWLNKESAVVASSVKRKAPKPKFD